MNIILCFCSMSVSGVHVTAPYRPDLLVRAARHYEGAGQVLLRQAVMSSQRFISIGQGEFPPLEEWQEVECPARLDLAGERTRFLSWNCRIFDSNCLFQAGGATRRPSPSSTAAL